MNRKALFSEMEFREGNRVLAEAHLSRSRDRNNKFVKDAVREVQRKVNFGYRERVFK